MRSLRHLPSSAGKFVIFAVICLILLVALAVRIGNISLFSSRHDLRAQLADVTGLTTGDEVAVAGVPVGQVTGIAVQRGHAVVTMSVNNTLRLHRGSDVGLRWENVIGQKEVYLYPESHGPLLASGATIPLSHDVSDASVDAFLNSIGPFLTAINAKEANEFVRNVSGALQGDTVEIDQLIDNAATVSNTVGSLDVQVGQVIDSLNQVLGAVASRSGDVSSLVTNLQAVSSALASHNSLLDDVVTNLAQVAGDLATLITQNRSTLDGSISDLQTVTQTIAGHQQQLAESLSTLGAGLAPYTEISSYGQWFQVQTIYTCLANQTSCSYYEPTSPPSGSGVGGSPPSGLPTGTTPSLPSAAPSAGSPAAAPNISSILSTVAGANQAAAPSSAASGGGS